jgi:AraC family transcriptional regulator, regulatory protein of adaptative response / DNA-3-methyladenine glycosylase II
LTIEALSWACGSPCRKWNWGVVVRLQVIEEAPATVASAVTELASAVATGAVRLDGTAGHDELIWSLVALAGVETNAAQQIALRLGHHDVFPHTDPLVRWAVRQIAPSVQAVDDVAERWRPWRALAATHLLAHIDAAVAATHHKV